jgi:3-oxoacyl-[acyl-carrier protein] reductase
MAPDLAKPLDGLVAFVTGTARLHSIGHTVAIELARAGADVIASDIGDGGVIHRGENAEADTAVGWRGLSSLVEEIEALGRRAIGVTGNVALAPDVRRMTRDAIDHFGRVDILVNNAAAPVGPDRAEYWDVPPAAFDTVMDVNLRGTFLMCKELVPLMAKRGWGRVINNASHAGKIGQPRLAAYSASKFGMLGLTQALARETGADGVTVNAVCPAHIETSRWNSGLGLGSLTAEEVEAKKARMVQADNPVGRAGTPEDVAHVITFLASPEASYITGQAINVVGGWIMQ